MAENKFVAPRSLKIANRVVGVLTRTPIPTGPMVLLTVPGRKSGLPRRTPIAISEHGDGWTVIAPYGIVDWVRNLRAAGQGTITRRGRRIDVTAAELPAPVAGPLLRESLQAAGESLQQRLLPHFDTPLDASDEAWMAEVPRHPVFLLRRATA